MNFGTKLLKEPLVFGISVSFLLYEYIRYKSEQIQDEKRKTEKAKLQRIIHEYGIITGQNEVEIKSLRRKMFEFEDRNRT